MSDRYTEYSEESWLDRLKESIKSVGAGLLMLLVAFPLLYWNEGRAVRTARGLEEGAGKVVTVKADRIDASNEGKLIHTSGTATTSDTLTDPTFNISVKAIRLVRKVEMYQWKESKETEKKKKLGGGTVKKTTYEYERIWAERHLPSRHFKVEKGHVNPTTMPYESEVYTAQKVTLGGHRLSAGLIRKISGEKKLPIAPEMVLKMRGDLASRVRLLEDGTFYIGYGTPSKPEIGDIRVAYRMVTPAAVSVVGKQHAGGIGPYSTDSGDDIELLQMGAVDAQRMFKTALESNATLTWILRGIGFALMFFGLLLFFRPLSTLLDVVPVLGDLFSLGVALFAAIVSLALSGVTIGVAWIVHRPLLGVPLLVVGVGLVVGLKLLGHKRAAARPHKPALST
jgi:hypothetical protein